MIFKIQATAIGFKVLCRETAKVLFKGVTKKCYGGDISRKRKFLEKRKKGKKPMCQIRNAEISQKAFIKVLSHMIR